MVRFYYLAATLSEKRAWFYRERDGRLQRGSILAMSVIIMLSGMLSDWLVKQGREEKNVRKLFIIAGLAVGCLIVPAGMVRIK